MFRTTVALRTIFYKHVEVISLWIVRRDEKAGDSLIRKYVSLAYLVLIVEILLKQLYPTKTCFFVLFKIRSQKLKGIFPKGVSLCCLSIVKT